MSPPGLHPLFAEGEDEQVCASCGCTAARACYRPDKGVCWWVEEHLCSHCARPWEASPARTPWPAWLIALVAALAIAALLGLALATRVLGWW